VAPADSALQPEAVEEPAGLEAIQLQTSRQSQLVELVAVAICIYQRIMVQAEEGVALALPVRVAPVAVASAAATQEALRVGPGLAPDMALAVVVDFKLAEALSQVALLAQALQVLSLFPI
jgi:hypothetical protein